MSTTGTTTRREYDGGFTETANYAQDSIEISRTAKGETTWSVKCYGYTDETFSGKLLEKVMAIHRELEAKFYPAEKPDAWAISVDTLRHLVEQRREFVLSQEIYQVEGMDTALRILGLYEAVRQEEAPKPPRSKVSADGLSARIEV